MKVFLVLISIVVLAGGYFWFKPNVDQFFHERRMEQLERKQAEAEAEALIIKAKMVADPSILSECTSRDKTLRTNSVVESDGGTRANVDRTNTIVAAKGRVLLQTEAIVSTAGSIALRINKVTYGAYAPAKETPLANYFAKSVSHRLTCYDVGRLGDASCKISSTITIPEVSEKCAKQMIDRIDF